METKDIQYKEIKTGDILLIQKNPVKVISAGSIPNANDHGEGPCTKVVLENGDEYFGWATRTLKLILN